MIVPGPFAVAAAVLAGLTVSLVVPRRAGTPGAPEEQSPSPLRRLLRGRQDAGLPVGHRVLAGVLLAAGVAAAAWGPAGPAGLLLGTVAGSGAAVGLGWLEPAAARRRRWSLLLGTPQALDLLAAGLLAGLPLRRSAAAVVAAAPGPVADELRTVLDQIEVGVGDVGAWRSLADHPQLGRVSADLARSVESGTMVADTLELHARDARAERQAALEVRARQVGVRSVLPLMVCFIPAFLLLGIVPTLVSAVLNAVRG